MKKLISILSIFVVTTTLLSAQVLPKQGVENTLSLSMGLPYDDVNNSRRANFNFYGFVDTLQVRVDIFKFTIEGMLNWGALNNGGGFSFVNTGITPFYFTNNRYSPDGNADSYYVNFLFHPAKYFDLGMGTRLNWIVGPAPGYGGMLWEPTAHVVQGGLKSGKPGSADVVGFVPYANCYARSALAVRFKNDMIEAGVAIPNGATTNRFLVNLGFSIKPADWILIGSAFDVDFGGASNLYFGTTLKIKNEFLVIDAYLAIDNLFGAKEDVLWGTGAGVKFNFSKIGLSLRPELGLSFYQDTNYSLAIYTGIKGELVLNNFVLGLWSSFAWGAVNKNWPKEMSGGFVFDIRPDVTYNINKNHSISAMFDYQNRLAFNNTRYDAWSTSVYWTFKM